MGDRDFFRTGDCDLDLPLYLGEEERLLCFGELSQFLWGDEERSFLGDLSLSLLGDDLSLLGGDLSLRGDFDLCRPS